MILKPNMTILAILRETRRLSRTGRRILLSDGPVSLAASVFQWCRAKYTRSRFDARFGVHTSGLVEVRDLDASGPNLCNSSPYLPSPPNAFDHILRRLPIRFSDFTFIDLGCGKGVALLLAAKYHFCTIVGVEFAESLYRTASQNVATYRQQLRTPIEIVFGDVVDYVFPGRPLVVYMFNPFGPPVMARILKNLQNSLNTTPRECWIVYYHPVLHGLINKRFDFVDVYEEVLTERSGLTYAIYRLKPTH